MTPTNFDFDALDNAINEAPTAGFGPRSVFGKMTAEYFVASWKNNKLTLKPMVAGVAANKAAGEYVQIHFAVDVTEMNPAMTNEWKRKVDVRQSNKSDADMSKHVLTDWTETVFPSLQSALGKDWAKKLAKGIYVEVEEAVTVEREYKGPFKGELRGWISKDKVDEFGNPVRYTNSVPRLLRVFKSKAECQAAREERFGKQDDGFGPPDGSDIPADVISDVKGVMKAIKDHDQLLKILQESYTDYDLPALLTAAGAPEELIGLAS